MQKRGYREEAQHPRNIGATESASKPTFAIQYTGGRPERVRQGTNTEKS